MVTVTLWGSLADLAGGQRNIEVEAKNLRELLTALDKDYPALRPQLERGVSVSIDGKIYNDSWFQPITESSEVVLLNRLEGG
ncbi:MoaD/ThiS family protein [Lentibacter sp. XHP0401]|jgi:sulfur-carrier protein|uniref:MoaD/ThiS family protein n=1 Tax=Lentibacter sp. XHP0401 TaxID=2984334 RepID=UPI0021E7006A|nr:MoaD/ThiS family protein [Lentibacter sp. XHP0401]MCV2893134.1 MoaD/ThiS family protein [Lentibacter sp. XHP0401]